MRRILFLCLALHFAPAALAQQTGNLLRNPDFQDDWLTQLPESKNHHWCYSSEFFHRRDFNPDGWWCKGSWLWLNAEEYGMEGVSLQVLTPDQDAARAFLAEIRRLMVELNVFRGQVIDPDGNYVQIIELTEAYWSARRLRHKQVRLSVLELASVATRLPAQDLDRARRFYADKLGLLPVESRPGGLRYECGAGGFALFESSGRPSGEHTQMA